MFSKHLCLENFVLLVCLCLSALWKNVEAYSVKAINSNERNSDVIGFVAKASEYSTLFGRGAGNSDCFMNDFPQLKTICLVDFYDGDLVQLAKSRNISVLSLERPSSTIIHDYRQSVKWAQNQTLLSLNKGLDGVIFRYQEPIQKKNIIERQNLNRFLDVVKLYFKQANLLSGFEAPYSPYDSRRKTVGNRNYDWKTISQTVDRFIVTEYDQNLQYSPDDDDDGRCFAKADANLYTMIGGLMAYSDLGVDLNKMTIILPLYGLDYQCVVYRENMRCEIEKDEQGFCSNTVATRRLLNEITIQNIRRKNANLTNKMKFNELFGNNSSGDQNRKNNHYSKRNRKFAQFNGVLTFWDEHSSTVYDLYLDEDHGLMHQFYHERPDTLDLKLRQAMQFPLGGYGYWPINAYNRTFSIPVDDNDANHTTVPLSRRLP